MEKIKEINTSNMSFNAFDLIMHCKELAENIDISNIIIENTSIDEKEMLISLIQKMRTLELEIIEVEKLPEPKAKA